jgi:hypothetical protein
MVYEFIITGKDFITAMWGILQGLARRRTYLPLFQDVVYVTQDWTSGKILCDTRYRRFFAGHTVAIAPLRYDNSYKEGTSNDTAVYYTATIATVEDDGITLVESPLAAIKKGTAIYPAIYAEIAIDENSVGAVSGERAILNLSLKEVFGGLTLPIVNSEYVPTKFYDTAFFDFEWNWATQPKIGVSRDADKHSAGRYQIAKPKTGFSTVNIDAVISVHSRQEWWDFEGFLDYIKGRYRPFWVKNPLDVVRKGTYLSFGSGHSEIELYFLGGGNNVYSIQALWLLSSDCTEVVTKVQGIRYGNADGYFIFEIDTVTLSDIIEVKQAFFVRSTSDKIKEKWFTKEGVVEVKMSMVELPAGYL